MLLLLIKTVLISNKLYITAIY